MKREGELKFDEDNFNQEGGINAVPTDATIGGDSRFVGLEKQILELSQKELTDEEQHEIKSKVFDILHSPDTVLHSTSMVSFYDILRLGLLSPELLQKISGITNWNRQDSHIGHGFGKHARETFDNNDLISVTLNRNGEAGEQILQRSVYPHTDPEVNLIYSEKDISDKFKGVVRRGNNREKIKEDYLEANEGYPGECMIGRKIENKYLRGVAVNKEFLATKLGDFFDFVAEDELSRERRSFESYLQMKKEEPARKREMALTDLSRFKEIMNFFSEMGVELIDAEETDVSNIYKINLLYKGRPVTITKEGGVIKIPDKQMEKDIADKIRIFSDKELGDRVKSEKEGRGGSGVLSDLKEYFSDLSRSLERKEATSDEFVVNSVFTEVARFLRRLKERNKNMKDLLNDLEDRVNKPVDEEPLPVFQYKISGRLAEVKNLIDSFRKTVGDVTVADVMKLVEKQFLIPIYSVDRKTKSCTAIIP
jgi:hypothetical protein